MHLILLSLTIRFPLFFEICLRYVLKPSKKRQSKAPFRSRGYGQSIQRWCFKPCQSTLKTQLLNLNYLPVPKTPRTTHEFRAKWSSIQPQILDLLSSPSRRHFGSIERGLQNVLDVSDITQAERNLLYIRVNEVIRKKPTSRRRIQRGGELNAEYAQGLIREKEKKRSEKYTNRLALARTRTKNRVKRELNQLGVINRRLERSRVKTLKQVLPNDLGASHLTIPIPDPEKTANWEQIFAEIESTIPEGFGLETGDPETMFEDRPVELVEPEPMVQPSSGWLQDDFVAFEDSSSSASSDDSVFHSSP